MCNSERHRMIFTLGDKKKPRYVLAIVTVWLRRNCIFLFWSSHHMILWERWGNPNGGSDKNKTKTKLGDLDLDKWNAKQKQKATHIIWTGEKMKVQKFHAIHYDSQQGEFPHWHHIWLRKAGESLNGGGGKGGGGPGGVLKIFVKNLKN